MALAAGVCGTLGYSLSGGLVAEGQLAAKDREIAALNARLKAMTTEVAALRQEVAMTAERIEERQEYLAALLEGDGTLDQLVEAMPQQQLASAASTGAAPASSVVEPLRKLEAAQLAFVEQADVAARARLAETQATLRKLGLDPSRLMRQTSVAMGGPLEGIDGEGGPAEHAEPKFRELFMSWKKLDLLEKGLLSVPSSRPVQSFTYTSGFGVRYDPFTGATALHAGVDMAGPVGEPIYAAADGVVERAGVFGGYGNLIELAHGQGIDTRYGHLSKILVRPGDRVKKGELIGRMGSTGRSTGSHLHYEVRIDGRAVNPMPFLEAGGSLLAAQERARNVAQGGPAPNDPS